MKTEKTEITLQIVKCILIFLLVVTVAVSTFFICTTMKTCANTISLAAGSASAYSSLDSDSEHLEQDVLSMYYAQIYLHMDEDNIMQMIESGELDGTYFQAPGGSYHFVRERLYQWCLDQTQ